MSRDFIRFLPNQRVDLPDFLAVQRNNRSESRLGLLHLCFADDTSNAKVKRILGGFTVSEDGGGPSSFIEISPGAASSFEILPDGSSDKGVLFGLSDPTGKTLDFSGNPAGNYGVFIRFAQDPGAIGARVFWNANTEAEDVDSIETRLITGWDAVIAVSSPGTEWIGIAEVAWNGATVTNGDITRQRVFFFEGDEAAAYANEWGDGVNDRDADRSTYGVRDLHTFVHAMRRQIEDILGGGQRWWEAPNNPINDHVADNTDPHGASLFQTDIDVGGILRVRDGNPLGTLVGYWNVDEFVVESADIFVGSGTQQLLVQAASGEQTLTGQGKYTWSGNGAWSVYTSTLDTTLDSAQNVLVGPSSALVRLRTDGTGSLEVTSSGGGQVEVESRFAVYSGAIGGDELFRVQTADMRVGAGGVGPDEGFLTFNTAVTFYEGQMKFRPDAAWSTLTPTIGTTGNTGFFDLQRSELNTACPLILSTMNGLAVGAYFVAADVADVATGNYFVGTTNSTGIEIRIPLQAFGVPNGAVVESIRVQGAGSGGICDLGVTLTRVNDTAQTGSTIANASTGLVAAGTYDEIADGLAIIVDFDTYSYIVNVIILADEAASDCRCYQVAVEYGMPALIPKISGEVSY